MAIFTDSASPECVPGELENAEKIKCDICKRELKNAAEWIRTNGGFICETCYQSLLSPNMKINFSE